MRPAGHETPAPRRAPQLGENHAYLGKEIDIVGIMFQSVTVGGQRFVKAAGAAKGLAQIDVTVDEIRLELDGLQKGGDGFGQMVGLQEHAADAVVGCGEIGFEFGGAAVSRQRLVVAPHLAEYIAQIGVRRG